MQNQEFLPLPLTAGASLSPPCKGECAKDSHDSADNDGEPDPGLYRGLINANDGEDNDDDQDSGNGSVLEFLPTVECQVKC